MYTAFTPEDIESVLYEGLLTDYSLLNNKADAPFYNYMQTDNLISCLEFYVKELKKQLLALTQIVTTTENPNFTVTRVPGRRSVNARKLAELEPALFEDYHTLAKPFVTGGFIHPAKMIAFFRSQGLTREQEIANSAVSVRDVEKLIKPENLDQVFDVSFSVVVSEVHP